MIEIQFSLLLYLLFGCLLLSALRAVMFAIAQLSCYFFCFILFHCHAACPVHSNLYL